MISRALRPDSILSPTVAPLWLAVASAAILAVAFWFQFVLGLLPCPLCLWQRWPYWAVIGVSVVALLVPARGWIRLCLIAAAGLMLLVGAGLAGFHVGVEQGWWPGLGACDSAGAGAGSGMDTTALREQLLQTPVVRCDQAPWSLLGISMAGYNFLLALGLGTAALTTVIRSLRRR